MLDRTVKHYTTELKKIDPDLELVKASNTANVAGLRPGYFHVLRKGMPCTLLVLEGPNGEFREPDSTLFDFVHQQDLWNDRAQGINKERQRKLHEARERQTDRERQARVEEANERIASLNRESISFSPDVKMRPSR